MRAVRMDAEAAVRRLPDHLYAAWQLTCVATFSVIVIDFIINGFR